MPRFPSHAQQGEDVVLWRALRQVTNGRYVEVGANHPTDQSITRAFYDHGWRGLTCEPVPSFADLHRAQRPEDQLVQAAISNQSGEHITMFEVPGTGLSTMFEDISSRHLKAGWDVVEITVPTLTLADAIEQAGWTDEPIHFMVVDVEGAERQVLEGMDFQRWRPWVLVVESTAPLSTLQAHESWEKLVLDAGYQFCLFDGLSRFYVADEHAEQLAAKLSYPAGGLDDFTTPAERELQALRDPERGQLALLTARVGELEAANNELAGLVTRWRAKYLERWAESADPTGGEALVNEIYNTVSWKVTKPLRAVRRGVDKVDALKRAGVRVKAAQRAVRGRG
ncbi:MAG TPA: FkbM family methyltransferase [Acidimicrobiales bacterium]|nr:FkbM family methyltransferase [Acidimicrobiales bacterium]